MAYTTIKKPSDYFNTVTYTGNGSSQSITGVGFQPDFTWIKHREDISNHRLFDAVRGANKNIKSNDTQAEITASDQLMSFDSDGFTLGADGSVNGIGSAGVCSWNWLASNTTASNTDGSITSTVSANTTSGFSIVSYTGTGANATVGHGLGVTPKIIFWKRRDNTAGAVNWIVQSTLFGNQTKLVLNTTEAFSTNATFSQTNNWDSLTIDLKTYEGQNSSSATYIAYCFAEKKGFSKFGSYTGNGNADGTFVYTGFKPAWVMIKNTTSATSWLMKDNKRTSSGFNPIDKRMFANETSAESTAEDIDFVSNGFKMRTSGANPNVSGGSFIYMAFADEPLVGDNPATAR